MPRDEFVPLRNLAVTTSVQAVPVRGEILWLYPYDIEVEITEPYSGFRTGLHVPLFAMARVNWLATFDGRITTEITPRGRERAERLLQDLYEHAAGRRGTSGIEVRTADGWRRDSEGI